MSSQTAHASLDSKYAKRQMTREMTNNELQINFIHPITQSLHCGWRTTHTPTDTHTHTYKCTLNSICSIHVDVSLLIVHHRNFHLSSCVALVESCAMYTVHIVGYVFVCRRALEYGKSESDYEIPRIIMNVMNGIMLSLARSDYRFRGFPLLKEKST